MYFNDKFSTFSTAICDTTMDYGPSNCRSKGTDLCCCSTKSGLSTLICHNRMLVTLHSPNAIDARILWKAALLMCRKKYFDICRNDNNNFYFYSVFNVNSTSSRTVRFLLHSNYFYCVVAAYNKLYFSVYYNLLCFLLAFLIVLSLRTQIWKMKFWDYSSHQEIKFIHRNEPKSAEKNYIEQNLPKKKPQIFIGLR